MTAPPPGQAPPAEHAIPTDTYYVDASAGGFASAESIGNGIFTGSDRGCGSNEFFSCELLEARN